MRPSALRSSLPSAKAAGNSACIDLTGFDKLAEAFRKIEEIDKAVLYDYIAYGVVIHRLFYVFEKEQYKHLDFELFGYFQRFHLAYILAHFYGKFNR